MILIYKIKNLFTGQRQETLDSYQESKWTPRELFPALLPAQHLSTLLLVKNRQQHHTT